MTLSDNRQRITVAAIFVVGLVFCGSYSVFAVRQTLLGTFVVCVAGLIVFGASVHAGRRVGFFLGTAALLAFAAGAFAGRAWFLRTFRQELPALTALVMTPRPIPNIVDVPGSRLFHRAFINSDSGSGFIATLPLDDRTFVEFVSDAQLADDESKEPCTKQLALGWYRRGRCSH